MRPTKIKINLVYSHLTENLEVLDFQYDVRLGRRLKRRCIANEIIEHNFRANATRKNVGNCGNAVVKTTGNSAHMAEEEVDEDYKYFLDNVAFHIDVVCANNVGDSNINVNTSHNSHSDDDTDAQYKIFLENLKEDGNSYIFEVFADNQLFHVKYEGQGEERLHDSVNGEVQCDSEVDEGYQLLLNSSRIEGGSLVHVPERFVRKKYGGSASEEKSSMIRQNLQFPNEPTESLNRRQDSNSYHVAKPKCNSEVLSDIVDEDYQLFLNSVSRVGEIPHPRPGSVDYHVAKLSDIVDEDYQLFLNSVSRVDGTPHIRQGSVDYHVAKHNCNSEVLSNIVDEDYQLFLDSVSRVGQTPHARQGSVDYHVGKHKCNSKVLSRIVDEDYQLFLNSVSAVGDILGYEPESGVLEAYEEENDQSSTDSEPLVLEPNQHCGNSPFIYSKSYDSSWFADERNYRDSMPFSAFDPSPYRKGLMEDLERPFDQKEYDLLMQEASRRRPKERHRENRSGKIKPCPLSGVNKSNLDLYNDLAKLIDQVKEPHKVLFLLRGFFFWLKHVTHEGAFKPWLDAPCLKILQRM